MAADESKSFLLQDAKGIGGDAIRGNFETAGTLLRLDCIYKLKS
jgi:hypothetical protein